MTVLQFALLGLGLGGAYALLALGLVTIYRGTGVLNFGQGAVAMISAYVFFAIRDDYGLSSPLAGLVTVIFATLLGTAFYLVVMRQLRNLPVLARIVATLALLLPLQGLATLLFDVKTKTPLSIVDASPVEILGVAIPRDRPVLAAVAAVLALALTVISRRTRIGLAVRDLRQREGRVPQWFVAGAHRGADVGNGVRPGRDRRCHAQPDRRAGRRRAHSAGSPGLRRRADRQVHFVRDRGRRGARARHGAVRVAAGCG